MPTCPNGHQSGSDDWCEVCGHRMAGAVPPPPPPPPAPGYGYPPPPGAPGGRSHLSAVPDPAPEPEFCPQCHTQREGGAPFCEECRWNFLTNTATSYTPVAPRPPAGGPGAGGGAGGAFPAPPRQESYDYQSSRPSQMNRPAEPIPSGPPGPPAPPGYPQETGRPPGPPPPPGPFGGGNGGGPAAGGPGSADDDWVIPPPSTPVGAPGPTMPGPGMSGPGMSGPGMPGATDPFQQPHPFQPPGPAAGGYQPPMSWSATIGPDREYFMAMMQRSGPEAAGLNLPAYSPEQQRALTGNQITIGRRRHSTGDTPDIDLSVPPEDPGVSHQHAVLVQQPDGSWAVVDQNSTNGTTVNGADEPIQPFVPVPLQDGDRVHVGAWTTITIRRG
ncbi:FHA domain-containing protein [Streptomyces sp. NPDC091292]|uniref:FHA domain-containing protein n=1 Tax=Streptomyces sp. NPDC091292 TaxID=3365991 RepID=UPI0037F49B7B